MERLWDGGDDPNPFPGHGPGEGVDSPIHVPTSPMMKLHSQSARVSYSHMSPRLTQRLDSSRWLPWGHAHFHPYVFP